MSEVAAVAAVVVAVVAGIAVGAALHELAHYVALVLGGHDARLQWPSLEARRLVLAVEFDLPPRGVPYAVQVAAVAPLGAGVAWVAGFQEVVGRTTQPIAVFGLVAFVWCLKLSRTDLRLARGLRPE